jgi:hypothetical protein
MTHRRGKNKNKKEISCSEVLDVLFLEAEGFFMEVPRIYIKLFYFLTEFFFLYIFGHQNP